MINQISIRAARINAGKTQGEMGAALGVSRMTYARYERGETAMDVNRALKFAELADLPLGAIDFSCKNKPL